MRSDVVGVCPNCEQWQRRTSDGTGDCFNECRKRGFAPGDAPKALNNKTPLNKTCLSDGDYTLLDGAAWLKVGGFAVRIKKDDEGVIVDVYKDGREDEESIVSCYAFDSELEEI